MNISAKARQNPAITALILIGSLAAAGTATWAGIDLIDRVHTTDEELATYDLAPHSYAVAQHGTLHLELEQAQVVSQCRWLSSEIRALKDSIYVRRRDEADPDYIHNLEQQLDELEATYEALTCANLLA